MVHNGILMETIGISVVVSIGLFQLSSTHRTTSQCLLTEKWSIVNKILAHVILKYFSFHIIQM